MECLGPQCAALLLEWLKEQSSERNGQGRPRTTGAREQATLWPLAAYQEEAPSIRNEADLAGALEHLDYAVFRRYENQLTRAERARLDNTIQNLLYKLDRHAERLAGSERVLLEERCRAIRETVREGRERVEHLRRQAHRAELKLAQLDSLTAEGFEEFVAELFEALGFQVEQVGGTGDEGADLRVSRGGLAGVVQCKFHSRGVIGSPDLQRFLGTVHHTHSHKGFFVTTRTFSLAAERFAAENPIELVDGPRLVELVTEAIGPRTVRQAEPAWF